MARLEQRACGDLAMYWRALGDDAAAAQWARECSPRDFRLPPEHGHGRDGSHNFAPCLLAGAGRWNELDAMLEEYWRRGAGNEFNSPLYGARVYTAAVLSALLGGGDDAMRFLHRWTGFLALQAVVVRNQPRREPFEWADEDRTLNHQTRSGVAIPPTGMRVNGDSLGNPYWGPVLARVLGIDQRYHHVPRHWTSWRAPSSKSDWGRKRADGRPTGNAPNPWVLVDTIKRAEARARLQFASRPLMRFCREVVQGDTDKWGELARNVQEAGVPLPRGIKRFGIRRGRREVATWWEGVSPTRQKPSVPAAAISLGRTRVLIPAAWRIPSTQTRSRRIEGGHAIEATADETHVMPIPMCDGLNVEFR